MSKHYAVAFEVARVVVPLLILAGGGLGFFVLKNREAVAVRPPEPEAAQYVDTAQVVAHTGSLVIETDGQVVPYREVLLSAEVAGRVTHREDVCRAGRFVRKGELLLTIDPRDYELERKRLSEELVQADISLRELAVEVENTQALIALAEDDVELQEAEWNRQKTLLERRATSAAGVDEAKRALLKTRNAERILRNQMNLLETGRDRLGSAKKLTQIKLEQAELNVERTEIRAPVDGVVVVESVELDSFVQKGTRLVTIEDTSAVEVRCNLRMDELYWIWNQRQSGGNDTQSERDYQLPKAAVTVTYGLYDCEYSWEGMLWRYDGIGLDERTRTVPCRILVESPEDVNVRGPKNAARQPAGPPALVRGMFVSLQIHATPSAKLLQIPEIAVQPGNRVLRVRNGELHGVKVKVVAMRAGVATVRAESDELQVRDEVVVSPMAEPVDGTVVRSRRLDTAGVAESKAKEVDGAQERGAAADVDSASDAPATEDVDAKKADATGTAGDSAVDDAPLMTEVRQQ